MANEAKNRSLGEMSRVSDLIAKIEGFTSGDKATPEDVKILANEVKKVKQNSCFSKMNESGFM